MWCIFVGEPHQPWSIAFNIGKWYMSLCFNLHECMVLYKDRAMKTSKICESATLYSYYIFEIKYCCTNNIGVLEQKSWRIADNLVVKKYGWCAWIRSFECLYFCLNRQIIVPLVKKPSFDLFRVGTCELTCLLSYIWNIFLTSMFWFDIIEKH